jgi:hypothetical protein
LIFYDDPTFGPYEGWYRRILAEPRYTDSRADLRYFAARYGQIEAERQPLAWWLSHHPALVRDPDFPLFYERFYQEVGHQQTVVAATLGQPAAQAWR